MSMYQLAVIIQRLCYAYYMLILIWCLLSWFPSRPGGLVSDIRSALGVFVEPYLNIFRRLIPSFGGIDFSPIVAIFALEIIERLLLSFFY